MPEIGRRIVEKCITKSCRDQLLELAGPHQLGLGVSNGVQMASLLANELAEQGYAVIHIDSAEAYQRFHSKLAIDVLKSAGGELDHVAAAYRAGQGARIVAVQGGIPHDITEVVRGGVQGSSITGFVYAAVLGPTLKEAAEYLGDHGTVIAVADDILVAAKTSQ